MTNITNMTSIIVATEAVSFIINLILLYGNLFETHRKTECGNMFSWLLLTNLIALAGDAGSWFYEYDPRYTVLLYICNTISIVAALVLIAQFSLYITTYLGERKKISKSLVRAVLIFLSVVIGVSLISCVTGTMFIIDENGAFVAKPLYTVYSVAAMLAMIGTLIFILRNREQLGTHDFIVAVCYLLLPTVSAIINMKTDEVCFTYQSTTISCLIVFVMIQSEQNSKLLQEKKITDFYVNHDVLTGLFSRRAYINKLDRIEKSDKNVGVVFSDLNGLKYVNDSFGHREGDILIQRYAVMLTQFFRAEDTFRISGDEFVIIADKIKENDFNSRVAELQAAICAEKTPIACIGTEYGSGKNVRELISKAESTMYSRKDEFHKRYPTMQRAATNMI